MELKIQPTSSKKDEADLRLFEPYRKDLLVHCYRLSGSIHDAEDLVQETMLRAWQSHGGFRGDSSLKTWLYKIATNACLDLLRKRKRKIRPETSFPPSDPRKPFGAEMVDAVDPMPETWSAGVEGPEDLAIRKETISLAFLTLLQVLPARQRAILVLCDVLDWEAKETADLLGTSAAAVSSALHRARGTMEKEGKGQRAQTGAPDEATRNLLARYMQSWENDDVAGIVALLKEDAILSMPPMRAWYRGAEAVGLVYAAVPFAPENRGRWRLVPCRANGNPAFAIYRVDESDGLPHAFGIQTLELAAQGDEARLASLTLFKDPTLFPAFGFPPVASGDGPGASKAAGPSKVPEAPSPSDRNV